MILVVGGTGVLGRRLVEELDEAGERVRVLARGVHPFPPEWSAAVERIAGDLRSEDECRRAVEGCDSVVLAASGFGLAKDGDPRSVDRDGAIRVIRAAAAAGVGHVVMMSMHGAAPDAPIDLLRCKYAAEEALKTAGPAWTIIRMGILLEQWLAQLRTSLDDKGTIMVFGTGEAPMTFTSVADASAIIRRALKDPALRGQTLEWGTEDHTARELAAALITKAGRGTVRATPRVMLRVMSVAARPFSPFVARMAAAGTHMDSGAMRFDVAPARRRFPDIAPHGLATALQETP